MGACARSGTSICVHHQTRAISVVNSRGAHVHLPGRWRTAGGPAVDRQHHRRVSVTARALVLAAAQPPSAPARSHSQTDPYRNRQYWQDRRRQPRAAGAAGATSMVEGAVLAPVAAAAVVVGVDQRWPWSWVLLAPSPQTGPAWTAVAPAMPPSVHGLPVVVVVVVVVVVSVRVFAADHQWTQTGPWLWAAWAARQYLSAAQTLAVWPPRSHSVRAAAAVGSAQGWFLPAAVLCPQTVVAAQTHCPSHRGPAAVVVASAASAPNSSNRH